ncbi:homocysteine S-methyltransferase family protein [Aspergillus mulundensis]|uniref:Homocysteine S-methyltransferase n=1 Tax=Aspergillus mulundensis TaxID=1810919 RepID=A0A3D8SMT6_9EURO|nr:Homocysteine S-methyltransferase [Aspergillus mulundensis]RDW87108.1 Homocysteine S-methyltransferase [Aspergillus mulundensis]
MKVLLLDGGLGTTLESPPFNITFTSETPLWSSHLLISSPSTLQSAHRAFLNAGADILLTATYQSSIEGFAKTNASHTISDAEQYLRSSIPLVRGVIAESAGQRPQPCRVALSLGPYGATMTPVAAEYTGVYPADMDREEALRQWHTRRLGVFADDRESWDQLDYVAFETLVRTDEVCAVRGAMAEVCVGRDLQSKRKPWWICGVFPAEEVNETEVRQWVNAAVGQRPDGLPLPRPWGIGLNCTRIENVARIVSIMRDELHRLLGKEDGFADEWDAPSGKPWLVLYPDGTKGEKYDPVTKTWVAGESVVQCSWDESFWDVVQKQSEGDWEGIIVGGCCRAGPADIAALRRRIDGN